MSQTEQLVLPDFEEQLVSKVRAKSFVHTGAIVSRNEELCRSICMDLISGMSRRTIAQRYNVSRNSVQSIREIMDARGELEPLKKEVQRRLDRCVIYSLENLEEALAEGKLAVGQLPIAAAVLLDKKAALDGLPTARIEHISTRQVSHDDLNAWLDALPAAKVSTSDSPSGDTTTQLPAPQP